MKVLARHRAMSVSKLEELCTIAVTRHYAETRFREPARLVARLVLLVDCP